MDDDQGGWRIVSIDMDRLPEAYLRDIRTAGPHLDPSAENVAIEVSRGAAIIGTMDPRTGLVSLFSERTAARANAPDVAAALGAVLDARGVGVRRPRPKPCAKVSPQAKADAIARARRAGYIVRDPR